MILIYKVSTEFAIFFKIAIYDIFVLSSTRYEKIYSSMPSTETTSPLLHLFALFLLIVAINAADGNVDADLPDCDESSGAIRNEIPWVWLGLLGIALLGL